MIDTGEGYRGYTSAADTIGDVTSGQPVVDATDGLTTDVVTPVEHIVPDDELDGNGIYTSHTGPGSEAPSGQGDGYKEPFDLSGAEVPEPGNSQGNDGKPPESRTGFADSDPDDRDRPGNKDVTIDDRVEPGLHVYTAEGHQYLGEGTFDEVDAGGVHIGHIEASGAGPNETDDGDEDHDPESGLVRGYPISDERDTGSTVVIGPDSQIGEINIDGDGVDVRYAGQPEDETGPFGDDDTEAVLTQGPIGGLDSGGTEAEVTVDETGLGFQKPEEMAEAEQGRRSGLTVDGDDTQGEDVYYRPHAGVSDSWDTEHEDGADTGSNEGNTSDETEIYRPSSEIRYMNITFDKDGRPIESPEPVSDSTAEAIDAWRDQLRDKLIDNLSPHLSELPPNIDIEKIDHYCRALGVPDQPFIVLKDVHDDATLEVLRDFGDTTFADDTHVAAKNFIEPRLVVVNGNYSADIDTTIPIEHIIIHEKLHTSLAETIALSEDPATAQIKFWLMQSGFVTGYDGPEDEIKGGLIDEAVAEIGASTYEEIFMGKRAPDGEATVEVDGYHLPYKYPTANGEVYNISCGAHTAAAIEIIALQIQSQLKVSGSSPEVDQSVLESLFASRTSHSGISDFRDNVNGIADEPSKPGLYGVSQDSLEGNLYDQDNLGVVLDRIGVEKPNESNAAEAAASNTKAFIIGKLRKYEAETGYSFNLPDDIS